MGEPFAVLDVASKFLKPSTGVLRTRPECRQSLTYNMEYATCSMQHATYCMQHATYMGSLVWLRCSCWRALIRAHTRAVRLDELVDSDGKFRSAEIYATSAPGLLPARSAVNQRSPAHPHKCDIPDGAIMDGMISRTAWYAPPLFQRPRAVLRRPPRTVALGAASERSHATPWHAAWLRTYRYSWGTRGTRGPPPLTARSLAMLPRERCAAAKTSVHLARGRSGRGVAARNTPRCDALPSCQRRGKTNPSAATPRRQEGFRPCLPVQWALKRALSQSTGCAERAARSACARSKAATTLRH